MTDRNFGGVIWTNHALNRLRQRQISQGDAWSTWRRPESSEYSKSRGGWIYYRTYGNRKIEVVAKKNEEGDWIIISVWSKPVFKKDKNMSFLKLFLQRIFKK